MLKAHMFRRNFLRSLLVVTIFVACRYFGSQLWRQESQPSMFSASLRDYWQVFFTVVCNTIVVVYHDSPCFFSTKFRTCYNCFQCFKEDTNYNRSIVPWNKSGFNGSSSSKFMLGPSSRLVANEVVPAVDSSLEPYLGYQSEQ